MLSNLEGFTGVILYSNATCFNKGVLLYKNTPVNLTKFDSMANNGYDIDTINAPGSTDFPLLLDAGVGIASPPQMVLATTSDGGLGLNNADASYKAI